jgi:hypothetical protein
VNAITNKDWATEAPRSRSVTAENAELLSLENAIARLAIVRELVEAVCVAQGDVFRMHNKIRFYRSVLRILREKGIT